MQTTTTVHHIPTGDRFTVPAFTTRPNHRARVTAAVGTALESGALVACAGCGRLVAVGDATVTIDGAPVAVGALQCDRVVNDHPAFRIDGAPVAYHRATTVAVCARCNGAPTDRARVLDALEAAALDRLRRFA
jgi:uncharacterized Zn-binding protein involved in type VI secretion